MVIFHINESTIQITKCKWKHNIICLPLIWYKYVLPRAVFRTCLNSRCLIFRIESLPNNKIRNKFSRRNEARLTKIDYLVLDISQLEKDSPSLLGIFILDNLLKEAIVDLLVRNALVHCQT